MKQQRRPEQTSGVTALARELKKIKQEATDYFDRALEQPSQQRTKDFDPVWFPHGEEVWRFVSPEERQFVDAHSRRIRRTVGAISFAVKPSPLVGTVDQTTLSIAMKSMEAALRFHRHPQEPINIYEARSVFTDNCDIVAGYLDLLEVPEPKPDQERVVKATRERGPNIDVSSKRIELEDKLRAELATIAPLVKRYTTLKSLQDRFPNFKLWKILSEKEQEELLTVKFKPRPYARTLTMRESAVSKWAIEKDRQKLRRQGM